MEKLIKTKVTEILKTRTPIMCGTMMALTGPEFTAVCSNAGGLGILASAIYRKPEPLREALQKLKSLVKEPFAVNMNLFPMLKPPNQLKHFKVMIDEGVKIIETSGHEAPEKFLHLSRERQDNKGTGSRDRLRNRSRSYPNRTCTPANSIRSTGQLANVPWCPGCILTLHFIHNVPYGLWFTSW